MFQAMSLTLLGMAAWLAPGNEAFLAGTAVSGIIVDHLLTIVEQIKKGRVTTQFHWVCVFIYCQMVKLHCIGCVLTLFVCYIL